jgi:hypothetical protein
MRKNRFSEAQIIGMIKEQEAGMSTAVRPVRPDFRCQCKTCDERIHTMRTKWAFVEPVPMAAYIASTFSV